MFTKFLAVLLITQATHQNYSLWVQFQSGPIYPNASFTIPSPPSGFTRTKLDSGDGVWVREEEY